MDGSQHDSKSNKQESLDGLVAEKTAKKMSESPSTSKSAHCVYDQQDTNKHSSDDSLESVKYKDKHKSECSLPSVLEITPETSPQLVGPSSALTCEEPLQAYSSKQMTSIDKILKELEAEEIRIPEKEDEADLVSILSSIDTFQKESDSKLRQIASRRNASSNDDNDASVNSSSQEEKPKIVKKWTKNDGKFQRQEEERNKDNTNGTCPQVEEESLALRELQDTFKDLEVFTKSSCSIDQNKQIGMKYSMLASAGSSDSGYHLLTPETSKSRAMSERITIQQESEKPERKRTSRSSSLSVDFPQKHPMTSAHSTEALHQIRVPPSAGITKPVPSLSVLNEALDSLLMSIGSKTSPKLQEDPQPQNGGTILTTLAKDINRPMDNKSPHATANRKPLKEEIDIEGDVVETTSSSEDVSNAPKTSELCTVTATNRVPKKQPPPKPPRSLISEDTSRKNSTGDTGDEKEETADDSPEVKVPLTPSEIARLRKKRRENSENEHSNLVLQELLHKRRLFSELSGTGSQELESDGSKISEFSGIENPSFTDTYAARKQEGLGKSSFFLALKDNLAYRNKSEPMIPQSETAKSSPESNSSFSDSISSQCEKSTSDSFSRCSTNADMNVSCSTKNELETSLESALKGKVTLKEKFNTIATARPFRTSNDKQRHSKIVRSKSNSESRQSPSSSTFYCSNISPASQHLRTKSDCKYSSQENEDINFSHDNSYIGGKNALVTGIKEDTDNEISKEQIKLETANEELNENVQISLIKPINCNEDKQCSNKLGSTFKESSFANDKMHCFSEPNSKNSFSLQISSSVNEKSTSQGPLGEISEGESYLSCPRGVEGALNKENACSQTLINNEASSCISESNNAVGLPESNSKHQVTEAFRTKVTDDQERENYSSQVNTSGDPDLSDEEAPVCSEEDVALISQENSHDDKTQPDKKWIFLRHVKSKTLPLASERAGATAVTVKSKSYTKFNTFAASIRNFSHDYARTTKFHFTVKKFKTPVKGKNQGIARVSKTPRNPKAIFKKSFQSAMKGQVDFKEHLTRLTKYKSKSTSPTKEEKQK